MDTLNIFFIRKEDFLKKADKNSLYAFLEDKTFGSQKRKDEYCLGRFLVKYVLKKIYKQTDSEIIVENKKPKTKDNSIKFSISHSKDIVLAAFFDFEIGADIEFVKDRDFDRLFKYYHLSENKEPCADRKDFFYRFWTQYEAQIKLQQQVKSGVTLKLFKDYMLSVCSSCSGADIRSKLKIYELTSPSVSTSPSELINLKLVIDSSKNENTLVAQEINTAAFDAVEFFAPLNLKTE